LTNQNKGDIMSDVLAFVVFVWMAIFVGSWISGEVDFTKVPDYVSPESKVTVTKTVSWWGPSESVQFETTASNYCHRASTK
jgi:hypothetical protein